MSSNKCILLSYGIGGHTAQMNNLAPNLKLLLPNHYFISISDNKIEPIWSNKHFVVDEVRKKFKTKPDFLNFKFFNLLKTLKIIHRNHNVKVILSTGPGISFFTALYFKFKGVKIIHIETWSRFTTRSLTGRLMYIISDKFYVQNESLLSIYPKAIYSGLL